EPRGTGRTELRDVAGGGQGPLVVVDELHAAGRQAAHGGLDVVDLEMGEGVLRLNGRALEHGDLAGRTAAVPDGDRRLPQEGQAEGVAVERLRARQIRDGNRGNDHGRSDHRRSPWVVSINTPQE